MRALRSRRSPRARRAEQEETRRPTARSFAPGPDDPSARATSCGGRATKGARDGITHLARPRGVPARERRGQADLRRPVPDREPEDARRARSSPSASTSSRSPTATATTSATRSRSRRRSRTRRSSPGRAARAGSARRARTSATAAGAEQGRHAGDRRDPLHARERLPLLERATTASTSARRAGIVIRLEGGRADLLRRRHLRVRRHGADRAGSTRPTTRCCRSATTSRWARARRRSRSSCSATRLRPLPLGHVPAADRDAGRSSRAEAPSATVHELEPGDTIARCVLIVATYSIAACDLDAGQWGVATQSKFLAVGSVVPVGASPASARSRRRPTRTRATGPTGCALLAEGLAAAEVVERLTAADDGRDHRQLGVVDARGRQRDLHRQRVHGLGRRRRRAVLRRSGEHPRLRATPSTRSPTAFAALGGPAARRAAARLPRGRPGRRRRPARPAVGGAARRRARRRLRRPLRQRSSTSASTTTRRRSRSSRGSTGSTRRSSARRRASEWLEVDEALAAELRRAARAARLRRRPRGRASASGPAARTSRSASTAIERIDPVVLEELRRAMTATRLGGRPRSTSSTRSRCSRGSSGTRSGGGSASAPSAINAYTSERGRAAGGRGARRDRRRRRRPRGALRRRLAAARPSRSAARRSTRPPGTLVFIADPTLRREGDRRGGGDARARDRRRARRAPTRSRRGSRTSPRCRASGPSAGTRRSR